MDFADAFRPSHGLGIDYEGGVLAAPARTAIHFAHRLGAVVTALSLLTLAGIAWRRARSQRLRFAAVLVGSAVCMQIAIGIATVKWGIPLTLATLHNAGAAALVMAMANLLRALWPDSPAPVVLLRDVEPAR